MKTQRINHCHHCEGKIDPPAFPNAVCLVHGPILVCEDCLGEIISTIAGAILPVVKPTPEEVAMKARLN